MARKAGVEPEDLAQEVFVAALTSAQRGGGGILTVSGSQLRRYAAVHVRSRAIDATRRARCSYEVLLESDSWGGFAGSGRTPYEEVSGKQSLARARQMPTLSRILAGHTIAEIARDRGVRPSTVSRWASKEEQQIRFERVQPLLPFCVESEEVQ